MTTNVNETSGSDADAASDARSRRALVVSTNPDIRSIVEEYLSTAGYAVTAVAGAERHATDASASPVDLVVVNATADMFEDDRLVLGKGLESGREPLLVLASPIRTDGRVDGSPPRPVEWLRKPFQRDQLIDRARRLTGGPADRGADRVDDVTPSSAANATDAGSDATDAGTLVADGVAERPETTGETARRDAAELLRGSGREPKGADADVTTNAERRTSIEEAVEEAIAERDEADAELRAEIDGIREELTALTNELAGVSERVETLDDSVESVDDGMTDVESAVATNRQALDSLDAAVERIADEQVRLMGELDTAATERAELRGDLDALLEWRADVSAALETLVETEPGASDRGESAGSG